MGQAATKNAGKPPVQMQQTSFLKDDDLNKMTEEYVKKSNQRKALNEELKDLKTDIQNRMETCEHIDGQIQLKNGEIIQLARVEKLKIKKTKEKKEKKAK